MRMDSLLAGAVCLCLFGCATAPNWLDAWSDKTSVASDRIVIHASSFSDANGGTSSEYDWVLEKNGVSKGTLHFVPSAGDPGTTTHYEFPAGIHEECLARLEETRFFRMNSAQQHPGLSSSSAQIVVHYRGRKHVVTQRGQAEIDDGFNKMWLFLGDVQKRSKVVVPAPAIKRSGSQPDGVVSGLTPAGTLNPD